MHSIATQAVRFALGISLSILALLAPAAFAASTPAVTETWRNQDFGFASHAMTTDANDNVYAVGGPGGDDYLVVRKLSPSGALLWERIHDTVDRLRGAWMATDPAGNAIVLASIVYGSSSDPGGWATLKYDANGTLLWANSLPGPYAEARRVETDDAGNVYVAGTRWLTNAAGFTSLDSVLVKYSAGGSLLWSASFDNNGAIDEPYSLAISPDGTRIGVAGASAFGFMALMYDPNGNRLWTSTGIAAYPANDIAFGPGNATSFATGGYAPGAANPYPMALAQFDAFGNLSWLRNYSVGMRALRVRADPQGNVVATGIAGSGGYTDWMTIKADSAGNLLWSRRYDGGRNNDEWPRMLELDAAGNVYVTGTAGPNPGTGTISYVKGVVAKYGADGSPQWAIWDDFAGGKSIRLLSDNSLATMQWTYLTVSRYTPTGIQDTVPGAPGNLAATAWPDAVEIDFADTATNEFWVEIERCAGSGCGNFAKIGQTTGADSTGFLDQAVTAGTTYAYRARAVGFMGPSAYSNTVVATVPSSAGAVTPPATSPPAAPSNLTASLSGSSVVLAWTDNANNESQVFIERCEGAGCSSFADVGVLGIDRTTWTDSSTAGGRSYSYRVRAWNPDGFSGYSNTVTVSTPDVPAAPPAPTSLSAKAAGSSQMNLTWADSTSTRDGFRIERCEGSGCANFAQVATVGPTAKSYADSGLKAFTSYSYRIRAYNAVGDSPYSNVATAKTRK